MNPTALFKQPSSPVGHLHVVQPMAKARATESPVIESPADQTWIAFCSTLAAPVMLLPDLEWIEG